MKSREDFASDSMDADKIPKPIITRTGRKALFKRFGNAPGEVVLNRNFMLTYVLEDGDLVKEGARRDMPRKGWISGKNEKPALF